MTEQICINTLAFSLKGIIKAHFSQVDLGKSRCTPIRGHKRFPQGIKTIFPKLQDNDTIYTTFEQAAENTKSLSVDLSLSQNFYFAKRYYTPQILDYFTEKSMPAFPTFVGDIEVWAPTTAAPRKDNNATDAFDRFTLSLHYNQPLGTPELILSYNGTTRVLHKSVATLAREHNPAPEDLFGTAATTDRAAAPLDHIKKVMKITKTPQGTRRELHKFSKLTATGKPVDYDTLYPILNRPLANALNIPLAPPERNAKPYCKYLDKITRFRDKYLLADDFRNILPLASTFTPVQAQSLPADAKDLLSGNNKIAATPQKGVNHGPYRTPPYAKINLFFIAHKAHQELAEEIYKMMLFDGYGKSRARFESLGKYVGMFVNTIPGFSIFVENPDNPQHEIREKLQQKSNEFNQNPNEQFFAIYLSPVGKQTTDRQKERIYYQIKESLLSRNIPSQFIHTERIKNTLENDAKTGSCNCAYYLQNIAVAICAKLGGIPWQINTPEENELIIGIGAFRNTNTRTQYIGSAFAFTNTGIFKSFDYFEKNELNELAGSIETSIISYTRSVAKPQRLIIHYYKDMSSREFEPIDSKLRQLKLNIPVFVVTICKTQANNTILFDEAFTDKMPYSGRYVNLGDDQYLLCNNTRYEDAPQSKIESYPFPIKFKITCHNHPQLLDDPLRLKLIEQVYRFSRIYWKSVRQQPLPVTIKYPEMVAQIAPNFAHPTTTIGSTNSTLWFL